MILLVTDIYHKFLGQQVDLSTRNDASVVRTPHLLPLIELPVHDVA